MGAGFSASEVLLLLVLLLLAADLESAFLLERSPNTLQVLHHQVLGAGASGLVTRFNLDS